MNTKRKTIWYGLHDARRQSNNGEPHNAAVLYHYPLKLAEELWYKTYVKGLSLHRQGERPICNNPGYDGPYNQSVFNNSAWRHLARMVPKYAVDDKQTNATAL